MPRRLAGWMMALTCTLAGCTTGSGTDHEAGGSPAASARVTGSPAAASAAVQAPLVTWPDNRTVQHIFYHSLVVDPERAFRGAEGPGYLEYMVTKKEFTAQLQQLHENGYVLVHPQRLATKGKDGRVRATPIRLPRGKQPLVLSIDDISYYEYMEGDGFATDLFVADDGRVLNHYTDAEGRAHVGNYDITPIVDDFVRDHPDFSYHGDKGTIALTGYNGVFGYRTSVFEYGDTAKTRAEQAKARTVAAALTKQGWQFASHTWGHINANTSTLGRLRWDEDMWHKEVRPILGSTDLLIFPFGAGLGRSYAAGNPKYDLLHGEAGYNYFFPIDSTRRSRVTIADDHVVQKRIGVDGYSLGVAAGDPDNVLNSFFDAKGTLDPARKS